MNFIILASSLALACIVSIFAKKSKNAQENVEQTFWNKEHKSNFVRKKSLDGLDYITIPEAILSIQPLYPTPQILSYLEDLKALSALKIVNLTGISNKEIAEMEDMTANNVGVVLHRALDKLKAILEGSGYTI